jgi:hypothetical protein
VITTNHDAATTRPLDFPETAHTTIRAYLEEHDPNILRFMADPTDLTAREAHEWIEAREREFGIAPTFTAMGERIYHKAFIGWCFAPARE